MTVRRIMTGGVPVAACGVLGMAPAAVRASPASVPTWTHQTPASHPSARFGVPMAYDAATGTVVLFGGSRQINGATAGTWTWG
jgi:hypothetical protein